MNSQICRWIFEQSKIFQPQLIKILSLLIILIGMLSMYCAQQGFLLDAYVLLVAQTCIDKFFSIQIEPVVLRNSPRMRYIRRIFLDNIMSCVIMPATISFYFDLELFSACHCAILLFAIVTCWSRLDGFFKLKEIPETIINVKFFGLIQYPIPPSIFLIPLLFHVIGWPYDSIKFHMAIVLLMATLINLPITFKMIKFCVTPAFFDFIFQERDVTCYQKLPFFMFLSKKMNQIFFKSCENL